jgi:predicted RNA-binding protein with PIN domain
MVALCKNATDNMALHYFIDGYNVIWSHERFAGGTLQAQRERLLRFVENERPTGSARNEITVVFDGREDVDGPPWRGAARVIFSVGQDADTVIKKKVDALPNPSIAVVVTDDVAIQRWVKSAKAKVLSCQEFLALAAPKAAPRRPAAMDPETRTQINEEFGKIWDLK